MNSSTSFLPPVSSLSAEVKLPRDKEDAVEGFASLFVAEIFKSMRGASVSEHKSYGESMTMGMLDEQFAQEIARADGLGLRDLLLEGMDKNA